MKNKKCICLALQGGGAYGAFTWGILDKFLEYGRFEINSISATSSGSLNAVVLAHALTNGTNQDARDELTDLWQSISDLGKYYNPIRENPLETMLGYDFTAQFTSQIFDTLTRILSPYILNPLNYNPLHEMLTEKIDFNQLHNENKIKLYLCATNVKTGRLKIFENAEITVDTIMASACLPELYQSVEINGEYYWDGGFLGNPAIFPLIYNSNVDDIIIIHTNPIVRNSIPMTSSAIESRLNEITYNSTLIRELRAIDFVTKLLDKGYIKDEYRHKIRRKFMHIVRSDAVMSQFTLINKYKWQWESLTQLRDLGREVAKNWLANNFSSIGKKSTIDLNEFL